MREKLKALFDARSTWAAIGVAAGAIFGEQAANTVNAVGAVVMAIL
ncbi:hypothetical protein [Methylobacillus flagellatus]|nr:hypothetical protein [Methylobacillus flagellatus]